MRIQIDVNKWMRASSLLLIPTKMQVMWLGSSQQRKHADINDIQVLSTTVRSARNLGSYPRQQADNIGARDVTAFYRAGYYQLRQLSPLVQSMTYGAKVISISSTV